LPTNFTQVASAAAPALDSCVKHFHRLIAFT
jgi:hypothetical protein